MYVGLRMRPGFINFSVRVPEKAAEAASASEVLAEINDISNDSVELPAFRRSASMSIPVRAVQTPVYLHIYHVGKMKLTRGMNFIFESFGTGVFHAGVEVYGREWSYGFTEAPTKYGTGVFYNVPKKCDLHMYSESVYMGTTALGRKEVELVLERLKREWTVQRYDLIQNNCCHFCQDFSTKMGLASIPSKLTSLAGTVSVVGGGIEAMMGVGGVEDLELPPGCSSGDNFAEKRASRRASAPAAYMQQQSVAPRRKLTSLFGSRSSVSSGQQHAEACPTLLDGHTMSGATMVA